MPASAPCQILLMRGILAWPQPAGCYDALEVGWPVAGSASGTDVPAGSQSAMLGTVETGIIPGRGVFVAADVCYLVSGEARAGAVICADPGFADRVADRVALVPEAEPYRPGQFCRRELPPLRALLAGLTGMTLLVVDGYADLDPDGRAGLGAHAHAEFAVPVIGVAKSAFRTATHAIAVLRGTSARPLYVTAAGMPRTQAADLVRGMVGLHRMPDALRRADAIARHGAPRPP
jgi:deoxyribonuclease V